MYGTHCKIVYREGNKINTIYGWSKSKGTYVKENGKIKWINDAYEEVAIKTKKGIKLKSIKNEDIISYEIKKNLNQNL